MSTSSVVAGLFESESRLKIDQVACLVGWSRSKIYLELARGAFPAPERRGRCVRWRAGDLLDWLRAHTPEPSPRRLTGTRPVASNRSTAQAEQGAA